MTFRRVLRADVVAMVAALALLLVMAMDWYTTQVGEQAREIEKISRADGAVASAAAGERREDARLEAQGQEKNAWQLDGGIDRVILLGLLATIIAAVSAAWLRAAGRRFEPPLTPSAAAGVLAGVTGLLVTYRILQKPGIDNAVVVKAGAPLALVLLAVIALSARAALRAEEDGGAWVEPAEG